MNIPNLFAHFVYGFRLGRLPLALLVVAAAVVFSMACFAVIVAGLARTREQAIPVGMSVVFLLAALGGLGGRSSINRRGCKLSGAAR